MNYDSTPRILQLLQDKGFEIGPGLTDKDFERIEFAFKAKLPDDYKDLLKIGVPKGTEFPDWSKPKKVAKKTRKWIDSSFKLDIVKNNYWLEEFGVKPKNVRKATKQALQIIREWPPLLPVYSHRFISSSPGESGNPVISIYQADDSNIYGANIEEYFTNEFNDSVDFNISNPVKSIPHWSEAFNIL